MTLDEAIQHAREKSEEQRKDNDTCVVKEGYGCKDCAYYYSKPCIECAEEHEQLADWLEDYKKLKSIDEDLRLKYCYEDLSEADNLGYLRGYNKAIDDFIKKLEEHEHNNWVDHLEYGITWDDIEQIAEKLKEHKTLNIVHCKDCIHWGTGIAGETENVKCCEYGKYMVGANGYCVYGEKE